ncbi:RNA-dependent RNA polymerase 1 [Acrodontium crateriforme]|uniref:RNA-dependent RNA polymerase n=1 Tax=Acrodontium crateriforme TaxID=150365 RepID=A0AAQ3R220_9PEZI|nr:RNA-dependent RNA polymerase 1 [Acrodontium crateriforme]
MDIFVRQIPQHATNRQIEAFFHERFAPYGIETFHVSKMRNKPMAIITVLDTRAGQIFLHDHGPFSRLRKSLLWDGKHVQVNRSTSEPNELSLQTLVFKESQKRLTTAKTAASKKKAVAAKLTKFDTTNLQCGFWEYAGANLGFERHYQLLMRGSVYFGFKMAIIVLKDERRIEINYYDCDNIVLGNQDDPTISLTLQRAPKFYSTLKDPDATIVTALSNLKLDAWTKKPEKVFERYRLPGLDEEHEKLSGICLVYRVKLSNPRAIIEVRKLLESNSNMPSTLTLLTKVHAPQQTLQNSWQILNHELTDTRRFGHQAFGIRYQLHRLASNSILSPERVLDLIPQVTRLVQDFGNDAMQSGLRQFFRDVPLAGPQTDAADYTLAKLENLLEECVKKYNKYSFSNPYELAKRHVHINLIHKIIVTPAGTYLEGPEPEPMNRVLRKYAEHTDFFVRVVFEDEDGSSVRYDPRSSQDLIYRRKFKDVLDKSIIIAGRGFSFLGFSHSSLRSQSCWFMAPLFLRTGLLFAPQVLRDLGDFTNIRSPAKCAARIGQNFTDTNATVTLQPAEVGELAIVARNGRDFSDGVGTISHDLLREVWRKYGARSQLKPTALQIRFQGCKGMVSLDSRLVGRQLNVRSNMRKFDTTTSWELEICGAGFRPLPMVLNRQFIKILEDQGVPIDVFLELQKTAVDQIRGMTTSAINTSTFLRENLSMKATKLSSLIEYLDEIGLDYRQSKFLHSIVEMTVVSKLRDMKYRGRIAVDEGVTLYGIMDETGYLREGEVHIVTEKASEGGRKVIVKDRVLITRSPAMHPGDVQMVRAVDVPIDSVLYNLRNVVVFSQFGARDLPSQLSGGDLDGDLYNCIFDDRLFPKRFSTAADYPRIPAIELNRAVTSKDMSDFFVTFMETDLLGMICNFHMQLADRATNGTSDNDCIKLAGMASTAVDFSKTGIPVDMKQCPRFDRIRPDFMAPSPRVIVTEGGFLEAEDGEDGFNDTAFEGVEAERLPYRYYTSKNALGVLYRAIDEFQFLKQSQREQREISSRLTKDPSQGLVRQVSAYLKRLAARYGILYEHHLPLARDIQTGYEDSLLDILYAYAPTAHQPIYECEAFAGEILGRKGGAQGKPLRERSKVMRERFETVVDHTTMRITKGDKAMQEVDFMDELYETEAIDREIEALPRAMACLKVAVEEPSQRDRQLGELISFQYIAMTVSLAELVRYRVGLGFYGPLPRV